MERKEEKRKERGTNEGRKKLGQREREREILR